MRLIKLKMAEKSFRKGPHAAKNKVGIVDEQSVPNADERKTVILDEQLDGVEFDDKVWLYWTRNKKSIITSVVLAFAIIIGVNGWKAYKVASEQALALAYSQVSTPAQLSEFAKEHAGTTLAGVALLQCADSAYADEKFADAQKLYADAKVELASTILFGRALLGEATCAYSVDKAKGLELFKVVYNTASLNDVYRAQAGYMLALALRDQGKSDEAKQILTAVSDNPKGGFFAQSARSALMSM